MLARIKRNSFSVNPVASQAPFAENSSVLKHIQSEPHTCV
jgi:hypothetical protein